MAASQPFFWKELLNWLPLRIVCERLSICVKRSFLLGFEGGMWDLILVSTDYGLSFSFATPKM